MVRRSRYAAALDRDPGRGKGERERGGRLENRDDNPPSLQFESNTLSLSSNVRGILKDVCEKNLFILCLRERLGDEMCSFVSFLFSLSRRLFSFIFSSSFLFFFGIFLDKVT